MAADTFELFITEVRAGWLESRIILNDAHYDLSVKSTFSEPLKDLFHCLCDVHNLTTTPSAEEGYRHCEFEWGGEGWLYYWKIAPRSDGELAVSIEFKGKREVGGVEYPVWHLDFITDWRTLAQQTFTQSSELLWMHGFSGYYDRWTKDFPTGWMMRLGHLLHDKPIQSTDFSRELGYLAETR